MLSPIDELRAQGSEILRDMEEALQSLPEADDRPLLLKLGTFNSELIRAHQNIQESSGR